MKISRKLPSPPYVKWNCYKSTDATNPDVMELKVIGTETFDTKWTTNVKILIYRGGKWVEEILKLHSHDSDNLKLLQLWKANTRNGKLHTGKVFKLYTWLGSSKYDRRIRRFRASGL